VQEQRSFTFYLEDETGTPHTFEFHVCPDEQAARERAHALLEERTRYFAIEVFEDEDLRFRVERPTA
jgi:hypothetical protein